MANHHNHLVIMAGGIGSRFWPASTEECPKQFLDIMGYGKSMLQLTLERFGNLVPMENVWVVTGKKFATLVREQLPQIPSANILLEPCGRGTAPCICYVSWRIKMQDPRANIVVTPSDHDIKDEAQFRSIIERSLGFASETDAIVTLGLKPTHPATGYGYICADLTTPVPRQKGVFRVDSFKEKPDEELAKTYVQQKNYYWNSGIFIWNVSTIINAFRVYCPELNEVFENLQSVYGTPAEQAKIDEVFPSCKNISVDYAIMEHADEVFVCQSDIGWSDVGTWGALHRQLPHDNYDNAIIGNDVHVVESQHCIIHTTTCSTVVVQGLDGYIVVEKDGRLLIAKMSDEQRIKSFH